MLGFICQILHNIFHNVNIASSGEINIFDFTVWFPLKEGGSHKLFKLFLFQKYFPKFNGYLKNNMPDSLY